MKFRLFIDLDGVLADFDSHLRNVSGLSEEEFKKQRLQPEFDDYLWETARQNKNFYLNIPMMSHRLWSFCKELSPVILTAIPKPERRMSKAGPQKVQWVHKNLGKDVPVIVCSRKDKRIFAMYASILIDDRLENIQEWREDGGHSIHFCDEESTLNELKSLLFRRSF